MQSALPLPDLPAWQGDDRLPDVTITLGPLPTILDGGRQVGPALQLADDRRALLTIPAVATYLVDGGDRVTIMPHADPDAPDIRVFLYGTVSAALCYYRGLLPLHASAVIVDGRALLMSGVSGAGKSTLAAMLAVRGHAVVTDDVSVVDVHAPGGPRVRRGFSRLRLWRDATDYFTIATDALERSRPRLDKFHVPVIAIDDMSIPVGAVALLRSVSLATPTGLRPVSGFDTLRVQTDVVYQHRLGTQLGAEQAMFAAYTRLMADVPLVEVSRHDDLARLPELADAVLGLVGPR